MEIFRHKWYHESGDTKSWTDQTGQPKWGRVFLELGAYPSFTGWAAILDNNNVLVDFVPLNGLLPISRVSTLWVETTTVVLNGAVMV